MCTVEATLEKGTYIISAKVIWNVGNDRECYLTAYGPEKVNLEKVDRGIAPRFKVDVVASFAQIMKGGAAVTSFEGYGFKNVFQEILTDLSKGIGFIKTVNKSSKEFHCKMMLTLKGMKVIKPKSSPHEFMIGPGKEDVLGFFLSAGGFTYSKSQTFW
jgi:hypothetical protein